MSARESFSCDALDAVLGTQAPAGFDRRHRVKLIDEAATALLEGRMPSVEARVFLAGALRSWLEFGGNLQRDYLRVVKSQSRHTASFLWHQMQAHCNERQADDASACSEHQITEG